MYINGAIDYDKQGNEIRTCCVAGRATRDGELLSTKSGKPYATTSIRAYGKKDGTAVFLTVKAWDEALVRPVASVQKGDPILVFGRLDQREYNGKTYIDLMADYFITSAPPAIPLSLPDSSAPVSASFMELDDQDGELPF